MAIDMKKMKAKYAALQNRGRGNNKSMWFRPQDGEQVIRIVPTADGDPFKEFWLHYGVGKNPAFLSLKRNFGQDDPLDDFVRALYNEGDEESVASSYFWAALHLKEMALAKTGWAFGRILYHRENEQASIQSFDHQNQSLQRQLSDVSHQFQFHIEHLSQQKFPMPQ